MVWITLIKFNKGDREAIEKICRDIAVKDTTFKYEISENNLKIFSPDKDTAYKKGSWFYYKSGIELTFKVKEVKDEN